MFAWILKIFVNTVFLPFDTFCTSDLNLKMSFVGNFTNDDFNSTISSGSCDTFYGIVLQPYSYVGWSQLSYFVLETVSLSGNRWEAYHDKMPWFFFANCLYATVSFVLFCTSLDASYSPWGQYQQLLVRVSNSAVMSCFISYFTKTIMMGMDGLQYIGYLQKNYPLPGPILGFPILIMLPAIITHIIPAFILYTWVPILAVFAYNLFWWCVAEIKPDNHSELEQYLLERECAMQQQLMQRDLEGQSEQQTQDTDNTVLDVEYGKWSSPAGVQRRRTVASNEDLSAPWRLLVAIAMRITLVLAIQMLINYMILFYDGHGYVAAIKMEYHYRIGGSTCYYNKIFDNIAQGLSFFSWL